MSGNRGGVRGPVPNPQSTRQLLNFKNHCFLCLQPQQLQTLLELVRRDPKLSREFQPIIHYLTGTDPTHDTSKEECDKKGIPVMANLPPLCSSCYEILAELHRLHTQLLNIQWLIQKQTEVAREVVVKTMVIPASPNPASLPWSSYSERRKFHSRIETSGMPPEQINCVIKLVENVHTKIFTQGDKKVIFPAWVPPHFVPKPNVAAQPEIQIVPSPTECQIQMPGPSTSKSTSARPPSILKPAPAVPIFKPVVATIRKPELIIIEPLIPLTDRSNPEEEDKDVKEELLDDPGDSHNDAIIFSPEGGDDNDYEDRKKVDNEITARVPPSSAPLHPIRKSRRKQTFETSLSPPTILPEKNIIGSSRKSETKVDNEVENKPVPRPSPKPIIKRKSKVRHPPKNRLGTRLSTPNAQEQNCDICGELYSSSEIENHLKTQHHLQDYITRCPNPSCKYIFSCRGKMESHLRKRRFARFGNCFKVSNLPVYPWKKCALCDFWATSNIKFRRHLQEHESTMDATQKFPCPIPNCSERFALKQSIEDHINICTHLDKLKPQNSQECDLCGKWVPLLEIVEHLESHHVKEFITKCPNPSCPYVFSCEGKMHKHLIRGPPNCRIERRLPPGHVSKKCDICSLEMPNRHTYREHIREHEYRLEEKTLSCPFPSCLDRYALRQSLEYHIMTHDLRPPNLDLEQNCPVCNQPLKVTQLAKHLMDAHEAKDIIPCKRCPFLFPNWESLLDHLYSHRLTRAGGLSCDMCDDSQIKFLQYQSLRQHFFNVHKIGRMFMCEHCDFEFFAQQTLDKHKLAQHSTTKTKTSPWRPKKRFKCELCPELSFAVMSHLLSHKIKMHDEPPVQCKFCSKTFTCVNAMKQHERRHLGIRRTYKCRIENCDKVFDGMHARTRHMQSAHNPNPGSKLFVCELCGKGYNARAILKQHVDRAHLGKKEPRRMCEICGESFAGEKSLRTHKLIHSEQRPHKCHVCNQAFRHTGVLKIHLKAHQEKGDNFKPNGPMKHIRKRVVKK